jgi:chromosomal replication initiation ATPase DnaA
MDTPLVWQKILDHIKKEITPHNYRAWFSQTELGEVTEEKIVISVPSAFVKGQLLNRYEQLII